MQHRPMVGQQVQAQHRAMVAQQGQAQHRAMVGQQTKAKTSIYPYAWRKCATSGVGLQLRTAGAQLHNQAGLASTAAPPAVKTAQWCLDQAKRGDDALAQGRAKNSKLHPCVADGTGNVIRASTFHSICMLCNRCPCLCV